MSYMVNGTQFVAMWVGRPGLPSQLIALKVQ